VKLNCVFLLLSILTTSCALEKKYVIEIMNNKTYINYKEYLDLTKSKEEILKIVKEYKAVEGPGLTQYDLKNIPLSIEYDDNKKYFYAVSINFINDFIEFKIKDFNFNLNTSYEKCIEYIKRNKIDFKID
jgi:hypothetical protein